ncbi:hypothetical protein LTR16_009946, partial [Cryomyces antarcticus]
TRTQKQTTSMTCWNRTPPGPQAPTSSSCAQTTASTPSAKKALQAQRRSGSAAGGWRKWRTCTTSGSGTTCGMPLPD